MAFSIARLCMKSQPNHPLKLLSNYFVEIDNNANNTYQQKYSTFSVNNFNKNPNKRIENHIEILCSNFSRQRFFSSSIRLESSPVKVPSLLSLQSDSKLLRLYCNNVGTDDTSNLSKKEKLKRAVKDYGATVIIFHVTISLMSLGCCYLVVASGLDVGAVISSAGLGGSSEIANEAGLFVIAYAIHKVFAPVRISITLAATPFIVRYLRKINVLKTPRSKGV